MTAFVDLERREPAKPFYIGNGRESTELHLTADYGDAAVFSDILKKFPEYINVKDSNGFTPLHIASERGHVNVCGLLLDAGADLEVRTPKGKTALVSCLLNRIIS